MKFPKNRTILKEEDSNSETSIFMVRYLKSKQIGNKGEAFFESLISEYAIAHKIDGSKDVGLDFLCEWVVGQKPSQLLFGVQVKTRTNKKIKLVRKRSRLNLLPEYKSNLAIKSATLEYWKGFNDATAKKIDKFDRRTTLIKNKK